MPRGAESLSPGLLAMIACDGLTQVEFRRLMSSYPEGTGLLESSQQSISASLIEQNEEGHVSPRVLRRAESLAQEIWCADHARERDDMAKAGVQLILTSDEDYPTLLAAISDPPPALWIQGSLGSAAATAVAVIGSRRATPYGVVNAGRITRALSEAGHTVVSGAAVGIDAEAHRAALRAGGHTIAVVGGGLESPYPPQNRALLRSIIEAGGAVISESPMRTEPQGFVFPRRNRVISGLCIGIVVIEAAEQSGAMITARLAAEEHHREVMALPGPADSPTSAGCHRMIREGWAALVQSGTDCLRQLETSGVLVAGARESAGKLALGEDEMAVRSAMRALGPTACVESVARHTGLQPAAVRVAFTMLTLAKGCAARGSYRSSPASRRPR